MRINGEWRQCDDGITRPMIRGEILSGEGSWQPAEFLVDTGADCTVISAATLVALNPRTVGMPGRLGGLGGVSGSVLIETQIRLERATGEPVVFSGQFAAVTELEAGDISAERATGSGVAVCALGARLWSGRG